jgi:hypothetical protein
MTVLQDGSEVGHAVFEPAFLEGFRPEAVGWGKGMYGDLIGSITKQDAGGAAWPADRK